jgi:FAD/FMN-containing dehydrogenase
MVLYGATPGQAMGDFLSRLPAWATYPWLKLVLFVLGLIVIGASLHFNVWSLRQKAIDALAEDLSWAIHHLLNKPVGNDADLATWEAEYHAWCERVSKKLEARAFFTRADQLHFDRLGFVPSAGLAGTFNERHAWLTSQLSLKFERLRDVINWTQMRRR